MTDEGDVVLKENANFHFCVTGKFKVQSLMFARKNNQNNQLMKTHNPGNKKFISETEKENSRKKMDQVDIPILKPGDYFGEVSLIYGCKRSASIYSEQYGTTSVIHGSEFENIMQAYPDFKDLLTQNIDYRYADELRCFLVRALRQIDYLTNLDDAILVQIAMSMVVDVTDKNQVLIDLQNSADDDSKKMEPDEMYLIYHGTFEIYTNLDEGTHLPIEYLSKGAVLNSHNFLV